MAETAYIPRLRAELVDLSGLTGTAASKQSKPRMPARASQRERIRSEMRRVTWPSRKQVESTTLIVILSVFFFAAYFKIVDEVLQVTVVRAQQALLK